MAFVCYRGRRVGQWKPQWRLHRQLWPVTGANDTAVGDNGNWQLWLLGFWQCEESHVPYFHGWSQPGYLNYTLLCSRKPHNLAYIFLKSTLSLNDLPRKEFELLHKYPPSTWTLTSKKKSAEVDGMVPINTCSNMLSIMELLMTVEEILSTFSIVYILFLKVVQRLNLV